MKVPKIVACQLVLAWSLFGTGCGDSEAPEGANQTVQRSIPETDAEILEVAKVVLDSDIEWKDSITNDGRIAKLFQPPAPDPDEMRQYRVKEGEQLFSIVLARYGPTWLGTVVNFSSDDPMRQFERSSADECLTAIQSEFQFTGQMEKILGCAFP